MRSKREDTDELVRSLTLSLAPQRFAEMYLGPTPGRENLAEGEENITAEDIDDFDSFLRELHQKRSMGADETPEEEWGEWV